MEKVLFREVQKYRQPWFWLIFIPVVAGTIIFFGLGLNQQVIHGEPFGNQPMSDTGLIIIASFSILLMVGLTLLFFRIKMITEIRSDGIYFRYPPMINREKQFRRNEIVRYEVRQYQPIKEYGGWGVRTGGRKAGKAYNVSGNLGLQLELTDGKKVLLGTQRKDAIRSAMEKMMKAPVDIQ
ncbi:MAG: hypothetical protein KQI35_14445 [Bacteroidetes bacterium]|nr:hypothetical protein [Bacteroidota bacterium]